LVKIPLKRITMPKKLDRRAALAGLVALGLTRLARSAPDRPVPVPSKKDFNDLWADLAADEITASRALLKLAVWPKEAVELCRERLKALTIDEKRVRSLLADLGSESEQTWKGAVEELEYFDPRLAIELPVLMDTVTDRVPRARLVALLSGDRQAEALLRDNTPITLGRHGGQNEEAYFNFRQSGSWWAEHRVGRINEGGWGNRRKYWTRAVRAIVLLEHVGTTPAVAILKDLATGHPDAQPTKAAKEALARLAKVK
jgi:hypothetical protein